MIAANEYVTLIHAYSGDIFIVLLLVLVILGGIYWYLLNAQKANAAGEDLIPEHHIERHSGIRKGQAVAKSVWDSPHAEPIKESEMPAQLTEHLILQETNASGNAVSSLASLGEKLKGVRQLASSKESSDSIAKGVDLVVEAGKSAMMEDRWDQARKYFEEAMKLSPKDSYIYQNLAIICYEQGDLSASKKYNTIAAENDPNAVKAFRKYLAFRL